MNALPFWSKPALTNLLLQHCGQLQEPEDAGNRRGFQVQPGRQFAFLPLVLFHEQHEGPRPVEGGAKGFVEAVILAAPLL